MIDLDIDLADAIDDVTIGLDRTDKAMQKAIGRAVNKLTRWLHRRLLQIVAKQTGLPQKNLRRVRVRMGVGKKGGMVWVGLNPVEARHFGKVVWRRGMTGARAGRRSFPGTFAVQRGKGALIFARRGEARLPIYQPRVEIDKDIEPHIKRLDAEAQRRFRSLLEQEINFALNVEAA
ncbi:MAG: hypothetical protein H6981_07330 [Gammaproteobacteria bacterium]|nr:hypothetical protein [Gammaproteobacteria bacterium]